LEMPIKIGRSRQGRAQSDTHNLAPIKERPVHRAANSRAQALRVRNSAALLQQRQDRLIRRIEDTPDAPVRWGLIIAQIVQLLDDAEKVHRLLGSVAEIPPERVQLYAKITSTR
jgi:hypothetical protein